MIPMIRSFSMFIRQIIKDSMLIAVIIAPLLAALFFRFGIPAVESLLCEFFLETSILADYYLLFDLVLSMITPYMFCFASSMVMLTEFDENMTGYLAVTPVGKRGYVLSRLLFPGFLSFLASLLLLKFFSLTQWTWDMMITVCFLSGMLSIAISLLLFSLSHNRVEGMAMAKLSGLLMLGLPVPFFLLSKVQYLFTPLPSFWIAKIMTEQNLLFLMPAILTSLIWIRLLYGKFDRKIR
ncbi:ABC transporter permease [Sinanaerobacter chloroacetimidivorans]|uniref:ABC transporter permease n=1 Tax=Sinanaerobacter chloroacetimidivorans TaxID=2818044 RepID=A0A8J7W3T0_9FIRM|nr:ABC transporter permease [Sinanaerobacter chloroacetimidivorans]MBR0600372.1 ABC transporter permease [Sinanaerobacter chloroacetimidivorans]